MVAFEGKSGHRFTPRDVDFPRIGPLLSETETYGGFKSDLSKSSVYLFDFNDEMQYTCVLCVRFTTFLYNFSSIRLFFFHFNVPDIGHALYFMSCYKYSFTFYISEYFFKCFDMIPIFRHYNYENSTYLLVFTSKSCIPAK